MERQSATRFHTTDPRQSAPPTARVLPRRSPAAHLQQAVGNSATGHLIQAKLAVSQPGDVYEQEADRVAEAILRMAAGNAAVSSVLGNRRLQRHCGGRCEAEEEARPLQRRAASGADVAPTTGAGMDAVPGGGQPLPEAVRADFEPRFAADFGDVRVHTGAAAAASADAVDALAYTVGQHIVFAAGEFAPTAPWGRRLLAHELTHVLQQRRSTTGARVQRAPRRKWRYAYKTKEEAEVQRNYVLSLGLSAESVAEEKAGHTFHYTPLTRNEAEAVAKTEEAARGKTHSVTVEFDKRADSFHVRVVPKCPEAIPDKTGFKKWEKCFGKRSEAEKLRKAFEAAHLSAEIYELDKTRFGLYYRPVTETEAKEAGEREAKARPGFAEGMYTVRATFSEALKSYTFAVTTACPKGYKDLGAFLITAYVLAQEKDFAATPTVKDPCGLKGTFRSDFLFRTKTHPRGVKMQGSGLSLGGDVINFAPKKDKDCFEVGTCALTKSGSCAKSGRTVAVDRSVITLGSELLIEDVGARTAEDTGGRIKGKHIDVYFGTDKTVHEGLKFTLTGKRVCLKT